MLDYTYKVAPRNHQREFLEQHAETKAFAIHWEQGTGKTKVAIDNIAYLYLKGKIDGALIVAPNGIDLNWIIDEIPTHLPDNVKSQSRVFRYNTKKAKTNSHKENVKWCREHTGLAWMTMSYDAFMTEDGKVAALKFLETRKVFYVLDESTRIKSPGAKRTQRIVRTAWRAAYRRTLTGTPMPNGAFDIYKQMEFLDPDIWVRNNLESLAAFKSYFGVFAEAQVGRTSDGNTYDYQRCVGYKNLEELNKLIAPISSRKLKRDVLDLPPKIYQPRYFDLSPKQQEFYKQMKEEFHIWLNEQTLVTANLAMVRILRLQQISCGYLPTGTDEPVHMIPGGNPRLELLEELIEDFTDKAIIWARYRLDIDLIAELLKKKQLSYAIYDGRTTDEELVQAKQEFQKGNLQFFISNPAKGSEGITLHAAKTVIYYSNSFNLQHRLQSEDRAHRDGLKHAVNYIDLLGKDTIDKRILENLCGKMDTSDIVLGDTPGVDIRTQLSSWLA
jgi:SNF2 family DNA or RNA helicase